MPSSASNLMDRSWTTGSIHALFAMASVCLAGVAASSDALAADASVEKIIGNLNGPCALAVRPGRSDPIEVFVAECGTGRVIKLTANKSDSNQEVIAGFAPQTTDNKSVDKPSVAGIQSLFFLDRTRLVVAGGDHAKPFIRLYEIGDSNASLKAEDFKQEVKLPSDDNRAESIHCFHDLARTQPNDKVADVLVTAAMGDRESAGLWKVAVRANTLGDIGQFGGAKAGDNTTAVGGIAVGNPGYVAIIRGSKSDPKQANVLQFLNPVDGRVIFQINTDLQRIVALAYSPATGNLFAADAASGGIYRLDDASELGKPACKAIRVADVERPTAVGFTTDGTLYVTALGDGDNNGTLLKLTGEF
jgi:hypothetical protein